MLSVADDSRRLFVTATNSLRLCGVGCSRACPWRAPIPPAFVSAQLNLVTPAIRGEVCLVSVSGEADLKEAPKLEDELFAVIDKGIDGLVVDFSDCTFIDSTTLSVLVSSLRRLRSGGGQRIVVVATIGGTVRTTLRITGLDRVFALVASPDAALAMFPHKGGFSDDCLRAVPSAWATATSQMSIEASA
jgi:anti-sigma B factor antagonist